MRPPARKIIDAVVFKSCCHLVGGASLTLMSDASAAKSLSAFGAALAMLWSLHFNPRFEAWQARQIAKGRSTPHRIARAVFSEGGLVLTLLPAAAWWLSATIRAAFHLWRMIAIFPVYAWAFTIALDTLFGLPDCAR